MKVGKFPWGLAIVLVLKIKGKGRRIKMYDIPEKMVTVYTQGDIDMIKEEIKEGICPLEDFPNLKEIEKTLAMGDVWVEKDKEGWTDVFLPFRFEEKICSLEEQIRSWEEKTRS